MKKVKIQRVEKVKLEEKKKRDDDDDDDDSWSHINLLNAQVIKVNKSLISLKFKASCSNTIRNY